MSSPVLAIKLNMCTEDVKSVGQLDLISELLIAAEIMVGSTLQAAHCCSAKGPLCTVP
jgi:hypothetical protein